MKYLVLFLLSIALFYASEGGSESHDGGSSPQPLKIIYYTSNGSSSDIINLVCPGNLLEFNISSKDKQVSEVEIRLVLYEPYAGLKQSKLTDENGRAVFNMTNERDGKYQIDISKNGYVNPDDVFFNFKHCVVPEPEIPSPVPVPVPQPKPSLEPTPAPPNPPQQLNKEKDQALEAINEVYKELIKAKKENKDVSVAETRLEEANNAYSYQDYLKALSLSDEALQLAKNAKPIEVKPSTAQEKSEPQPDKKLPDEQAGIDMGQMLLPAGIVIALLAIYFIFKRKQ